MNWMMTELCTDISSDNGFSQQLHNDFLICPSTCSGCGSVGKRNESWLFWR